MSTTLTDNAELWTVELYKYRSRTLFTGKQQQWLSQQQQQQQKRPGTAQR